MAEVASRVRGLVLLTPCYRGLSSSHVLSLFDTQREMASRNVPFGIIHVAGNALLAHARNLLLARFLAASQFSHALFVDCDTEWPPEAVVRLLASGFDFCACAVPKRSLPPTWNFTPLPGMPVFDQRTGYVEIERIGTGFLMLTRDAVQRLADAATHHYLHEEPDGSTFEVAEIFRTAVIDGAFWGEDYLLCREWRHLGGQVWLDPDMTLRHEGGAVYEAGRPSDLMISHREAAE